MKIVVDKKITKIDDSVEDILSTTQTITETDDTRTAETLVEPNATVSFSFASLSSMHIVTDNNVSVNIQSQGSTVVNLLSVTDFSFIGTMSSVSITIENVSTEDAQIKLVLVV